MNSIKLIYLPISSISRKEMDNVMKKKEDQTDKHSYTKNKLENSKLSNPKPHQKLVVIAGAQEELADSVPHMAPVLLMVLVQNCYKFNYQL